jgi:hypothetical protein
LRIYKAGEGSGFAIKLRIGVGVCEQVVIEDLAKRRPQQLHCERQTACNADQPACPVQRGVDGHPGVASDRTKSLSLEGREHVSLQRLAGVGTEARRNFGERIKSAIAR